MQFTKLLLGKLVVEEADQRAAKRCCYRAFDPCFERRGTEQKRHVLRELILKATAQRYGLLKVSYCHHALKKRLYGLPIHGLYGRLEAQLEALLKSLVLCNCLKKAPEEKKVAAEGLLWNGRLTIDRESVRYGGAEASDLIVDEMLEEEAVKDRGSVPVKEVYLLEVRPVQVQEQLVDHGLQLLEVLVHVVHELDHLMAVVLSLFRRVKHRQGGLVVFVDVLGRDAAKDLEGVLDLLLAASGDLE